MHTRKGSLMGMRPSVNWDRGRNEVTNLERNVTLCVALLGVLILLLADNDLQHWLGVAVVVIWGGSWIISTVVMIASWIVRKGKWGF